MIRTAFFRFIALVRWLGSVSLIAWTILTGPLALISLVSDATNWRNLLSSPIAVWNERLQGAADQLPFAFGQSVATLDVLYICALSAFILWYYWASIWFVAKLQLDAATRGVLAPVEPYSPEVGGIVEGSVGGVGVAVAVIALGPPGWFFVPLIGMLTQFWAETRHDAKVQQAKKYAQEQTRKLEESRMALAHDAVGRFKRRETAKFLTAIAVVIILVAVSFLVPVLTNSQPS